VSRRFTDPVEVHTRAEASGPVPDQFLWHGRLYVVREVLARWTESGSWWRTPTVSAVRTGDSLAGGTSTGTLTVDDRATQWWRVEADSGRLAALSAGPGVYDLCFTEADGSWSLKRVMD
jgi:hypothetical protein